MLLGVWDRDKEAFLRRIYALLRQFCANNSEDDTDLYRLHRHTYDIMFIVHNYLIKQCSLQLPTIKHVPKVARRKPACAHMHVIIGWGWLGDKLAHTCTH